ncbi:hypothetical protein [Streptomyces yangpuensis]|uniref:hypothetical protein n=1 Tax=Streptomyces yangpuensis TaxID=1648182 RepID=UPI003711CA13
MSAQQAQSLAPLRAFIHSWAVFVEIERHPHRAARLHALEQLVQEGTDDPASALAEIQQILDKAEADTGL